MICYTVHAYLLNGHSDFVTSIAFSPDGKHIVSGSRDKSVRVWDALTGGKLNELKGHTDVITSVAFSPDVKHIVSHSYDNLTQVSDSGSWYIRERIVDSDRNEPYTGWLLSPPSYTGSSARLMFAPPEAALSDTSNILTIPCSARSYVDFTRATFGPQWAECYRL
jgi:WD40 repeat protein